jgi:hypothetical protein
MTQLLLPPHTPEYYMGMDVAKPGTNDYDVYTIIDEQGRIVAHGRLDNRTLTIIDSNKHWQEVLEWTENVYKNVTVLQEGKPPKKIKALLNHKGY